MKTRLTLLMLLIGMGMVGILFFQAKWQLGGMKDPRMVVFLRRYDRGDAAQKLPERARIEDRLGQTLSGPAGQWMRSYPLGAAAVHPIGYFSRKSGLTGCERVLDAELSTSTNAVRLTLDARLQQRGYQLLRGRSGAVVAIRPSSGRILALVSSPGFDPLRPTDVFDSNADAPLLNRPLAGLYAPGSTFKLFVAAAALSRGLDPVFNCPAAGFVPAKGLPAIRDSEAAAFERRGRAWKGWGRLGLDAALSHSSNTYFAQLAVALGADAFNDFAVQSRLRDGVAVLTAAGPLTNGATLESAGCGLPDVGRAVELAQLGIGQGELMVTPLAVAMLTCAIANDGVIAEPFLRADQEPKLRAHPFTPAAAARVKRGMRLAIQQGTGRNCDLPGLSVCGKTGTAQTGSGADHAWFTCFAPEKRPKLVITVLVEHGGFGADSALPIARELLLEAQAGGLL